MLEEMQLNPGVFYTSATLCGAVAAFNGERYIYVQDGDEHGLVFNTGMILAKDWHVAPKEKPSEPKLSDTLYEMAFSSAQSPNLGPEFARGMLSAAGIVRERGL